MPNMPPLTAEQAAVVEANRGLVAWTLKRQRTRPEEWDDRMQDGMLGLMRASQLYDPETGNQFSTYAYFWIRQAISRGWQNYAGRNYRYDTAHGIEHLAPLSLDADPDDGFPISTRLADPTDVEALVDAQAAADALRAELHVAALDDLDRLIIEAAGEPGFYVSGFSRLHGLERQTVANRIKRLRSRVLAKRREDTAA